MRSFRLCTVVGLAAAAALLISGLQAAITAGTGGEYEKAACAYNLMRLGQAIRMFAVDHGGYICELSGRPEREGLEGPDNAQRLKAAYAPYISDPEIWYCPADPYAKTHTLQPPDFKPPADQPDMKYDHFYTSYRHYCNGPQEEPPGRLDGVRMLKDARTAHLPGGVSISTPDHTGLMIDDGVYHGQPLAGEYGKVYGRNTLYRDGHVKFETEEIARQPRP